MNTNMAKEVLKSINFELRKSPKEKLMLFRIYIVVNDHGLPETIAAEWTYPTVDRHLTAGWLPAAPNREEMLLPTLFVAVMLWNSMMLQANSMTPGYMSAFLAGVAFINATNAFATV